ncbi:MAG: hypothetical protein PUB85_08060 [Clostridia bacterium]|nr:hypothetical protein [Clostridia bacterium]
MRFVYGFEEHTPENSVKFLKMLIKVFPFKIKTIQTDNGTEFTNKFIIWGFLSGAVRKRLYAQRTERLLDKDGVLIKTTGRVITVVLTEASTMRIQEKRAITTALNDFSTGSGVCR